MTITDELAAALRNLVDSDACTLDHHGFCQAHASSAPCANAVAIRVLDRHTQSTIASSVQRVTKPCNECSGRGEADCGQGYVCCMSCNGIGRIPA